MFLWLLRILVIVAGTLLSSHFGTAVAYNTIYAFPQLLTTAEIMMRATLIIAGFVAAWIPFPQKIRFNAWRAIVSLIILGGLHFLGSPFILLIVGSNRGGWTKSLMQMGWAIPVLAVWLGYELGQSLRAPETD